MATCFTDCKIERDCPWLDSGYEWDFLKEKWYISLESAGVVPSQQIVFEQLMKTNGFQQLPISNPSFFGLISVGFQARI